MSNLKKELKCNFRVHPGVGPNPFMNLNGYKRPKWNLSWLKVRRRKVATRYAVGVARHTKINGKYVHTYLVLTCYHAHLAFSPSCDEDLAQCTYAKPKIKT